MKPSIIYCDLDGVLADFDAQYEKLTGEKKEVINHKSDQAFWQEITIFRALTGKGWFNNLPPKSDYMVLWRALTSLDYPIALLTATGMDRERAVKEKTEWVNNYLNAGWLILFVNSGKDKGRYATKDSILIDDTQKCIDAFRTEGGTAILHVSAEDTIKQLKEILES